MAQHKFFGAFAAVAMVVGGLAFMTRSPAGGAQADAPLTDVRSSTLASILPPDLVVPARLPAGIHDAELLEAWVRLYTHTDPIRLWDGASLTGRGLAEFLRDHNIPLVWGTDQDCGGGSCSVQTCVLGQDVCAYANDASGLAPIYVRAAERGHMAAVVDTLAHEIFHRTQPFGAVRDTRFEEYWAFRIEYQINAESWLTFGAYEPLDPNHLSLWLRDNNLPQYFQLPAYPASMADRVIAPAQHGGGAFAGLPAAALGTVQ